MSVAEISDRKAVLDAIGEYDAIGEAAFLDRYGFKPARKFHIRFNGRLYASKAVLGAAHGRQFPRRGPLTSADFSGGEQTIRQLQFLGFTIVDGPTGREVPPLA